MASWGDTNTTGQSGFWGITNDTWSNVTYYVTRLIDEVVLEKLPLITPPWLLRLWHRQAASQVRYQHLGRPRPVARSRLASWPSLKEKRLAWGA